MRWRGGSFDCHLCIRRCQTLFCSHLPFLTMWILVHTDPLINNHKRKGGIKTDLVRPMEDDSPFRDMPTTIGPIYLGDDRVNPSQVFGDSYRASTHPVCGPSVTSYRLTAHNHF